MKTNIRNVQTKILSDNWSILKKLTYEFQRRDGSWETQVREAYDRGDGATILLYHSVKRTVLLTRQFRLPTYLNGNENGLLIETCAGKLDSEDPKDCVIREALEETGYKIKDAKKVFEAYMSPGSVTEKIYFYISSYTDDMKVTEGGGLSSEQENIDVLEVPFKDALEMIKSGDIQDGKTIMLLQHVALNPPWEAK
jgi:nudix-type nucleoside diphosphatase (YffH/AdpP family)